MSKRFVISLLFGPLCLVLLIWKLSLPAFAQTKPQVDLTGRNVLILLAFERTMPINEATHQGLRASLDSGGIGTKNRFFEYLNLAPTPGPEYRV